MKSAALSALQIVRRGPKQRLSIRANNRSPVSRRRFKRARLQRPIKIRGLGSRGKCSMLWAVGAQVGLDRSVRVSAHGAMVGSGSTISVLTRMGPDAAATRRRRLVPSSPTNEHTAGTADGSTS